MARDDHDPSSLWTIDRGASCVVATAIHEGHVVRPEIAELYALAPEERMREEDPFTEFIIGRVPNRIVFRRSRFEVDLNRDRDGAVYLRPEQAWGLKVWNTDLSESHVATSLEIHDGYYEALRTTLTAIERQHGRFAVLDVHSYNHRRAGPNAPPSDPVDAPDINIGTFSMDRDRWGDLVDELIDHLGGFRIRGRALHVRENVAFQGKGEQTRFIHKHFPQTGCAIAVEFKKFFMDEWTGEPDTETLLELRDMLASTVPLLERALERVS
ncbi:N-formylglutamate amidohydrolase [Rhizobium sp. S152]|uniref:N-formylglutamate amidohydrolase n=1 Tax=Rhizobium sp. S152 TaxID=3055038 RepID=UPI0025A9A86E|nr:N-formylglutamate amidohydrolase [Rhizobium sp. S152]MDM9625482.1 N-formylglutamate amidohydrolase [Rhizobium sp. S152]